MPQGILLAPTDWPNRAEPLNSLTSLVNAEYLIDAHELRRRKSFAGRIEQINQLLANLSIQSREDGEARGTLFERLAALLECCVLPRCAQLGRCVEILNMIHAFLLCLQNLAPT